MSLIRDIPVAMVAQEDHYFGTCSDMFTTAAQSTTAKGVQNSKTTASMLHSSGDIGDVVNTEQGSRVSSGRIVTSTIGKIIDRLRYPLGAHYQAISAVATLTSTLGSTETDAKVALGVTLFHGASSGGGDLAELSTAMRPRDRVYFSSARTTDALSWDAAESSGTLYIMSNAGVYDLRNAKRYIQVRGRYGVNRVTTAADGMEGARAGATAVFFGGDVLPPALDTTSPFSTAITTD